MRFPLKLQKPLKIRFNPRSYPKKVQDRVEDDYFWKLSDLDRYWLASFNESEYGANPDCLQNITGKPVSVEERRRLWREIQRYKRDTASMLCRMDATLYFFDLQNTLHSNEDQLIEMIDSAHALEKEILENLKFIVFSKDWESCLKLKKPA